MAGARVRLTETVVELQSARLQLSQARQKRLEEEISLVKKDVHFTADDRDRQIERRTELAAGLDNERSAEAARWREAIECMASRRRQPRCFVRTRPARPATRAAALLLLLDQERELLGSLRKLWKRRYELYQGDASPTQPAQWLDDVDETLSELKDWQPTWEQRIAILSRASRGAGSAAKADSAEAAWEKYPAEAVERLWKAFHASELELREDQRWLSRFRDELKAKNKDQARPPGLPSGWRRLGTLRSWATSKTP